jgi:hypothetical protein
MIHKNLNTKVCPSWSAEEVVELRRCLQTNNIAAVDVEIFGKRLSEIVRAQIEGARKTTKAA